MTVLVTGAAGFIGYHTCRALLDRGMDVVGIDNLNDYYSVDLKISRLELLNPYSNFRFVKVDISEQESLTETLGSPRFDHVIHLAAQAGIRYSLENPFAYMKSNLMGHMVILELCRHLPDLKHLIYASSSSVYGNSKTLPLSESDRADRPISLYAATKRSDELLSESYSHLYRIPQTGLRFFTVYGPWGRPDMAYWKFTQSILDGKPIYVYNNGDMKRDFTYVDDIISGILSVMDKPPEGNGNSSPHRILNIGNSRPESLTHMIGIIEQALECKAQIILEPMQPGDVYETYSDISAIQSLTGFKPETSIEVGLPKFVEWFKGHKEQLERLPEDNRVVPFIRPR